MNRRYDLLAGSSEQKFVQIGVGSPAAAIEAGMAAHRHELEFPRRKES